MSDLRIVWQNLHDETCKQTELDELLQLRTKLATESIISHEDANRFIELLIKHMGDSDLVHDIVMQISAQAAGALYTASVDVVRRMISGFVEFVCSQGWPFSYTDKIGKKCKEIYHAIDDPRIRAELIFCISEVGTSHNRFYVMDIRKEMFAMDRTTAENLAIQKRFLEGSEYLRRRVKENIKLTKLPAILRQIFNFGN